MTTPTLTLVPDPDDNNDHDVLGQADTDSPLAAEPWPTPPTPADDDPPPAAAEGEVLPPPPGPATVAVLDAVWRPEVARKPLLPIWLRDAQTRRAAVRWWAGHTTHVAAFHTLRSPLYAGRVAARSPIGIGRCLVVVGRWLIDARAGSERDAMREALRADGGSGAPLARVARQHRNSVLARFAMFTFALIASLMLFATLRPLVQLLTLAFALLGLGVLGRPTDRKLTSWAVSKDSTPKLTLELVTEALMSLGIEGINRAAKLDPRAIRYLSPVHRSGTGWRVDVELPAGVPASAVIERRERMASALRRKLGQVWLSPDPDAHEGVVVLFVADRSFSGDARPVEWPLAAKGRVDVFEAFPIGVDEQGRQVTVQLFGSQPTSIVIGAIPRMGKSFLLRLLCLAAVLDPTVRLVIYNLKGGVDFAALKAVAHRYTAGDRPDHMRAMLTDLKGIQREMRRRYDLLETLPVDVCPEGKLTRELASKRSLGLFPIVAAFDECQIALEHPELGKELEAVITDLVKRGPAVGIVVWLSTQRPDGKSIPTPIRDNCGLRFALKVMTWQVSDMILGGGLAKAGWSAHTLSRRDVGVAMMAGEGADPVIVRAAYIDGVAAQAIAERARQVRVATGWLSGQAAGDTPEPEADTSEPTETILDHLLAIWPAGQLAMWCQTLAERLADRWPDTYGAWEGRQVTMAVKRFGITSRDVKAKDADGLDRTRKGITLDDLGAALDRHTPEPTPPTAGPPGAVLDDDEHQADDDPPAEVDQAEAEGGETVVEILYDPDEE
ncbi:MAG: FtsK/SpoIIIE domain-containing protein [Acidimicrobiales bacterium]